MTFFSFFNPITFFPWFGYWTYPIQRKVTRLILQECWTTLVGRDKIFDSVMSSSVRHCKQGRPPKLTLSNADNKQNILTGDWSGFASVLEPFWQSPKTKDPFLFAINLSVHAWAATQACTDRYFASFLFNFQTLKEFKKFSQHGKV